jgi:hypothetical protein
MRIRVICDDTLQCHDPSRVALPCTVNHTHTAATDFLQNFVIAEPPFLVRHIGLSDNTLENFRGRFDLRFEVFFEETTHAATVAETGGSTAMLAFTCTFRDARH